MEDETEILAYYAAPEALDGAFNDKTDIWSIGVLMYVLISG